MRRLYTFLKFVFYTFLNFVFYTFLNFVLYTFLYLFPREGRRTLPIPPLQCCSRWCCGCDGPVCRRPFFFFFPPSPFSFLSLSRGSKCSGLLRGWEKGKPVLLISPLFFCFYCERDGTRDTERERERERGNAKKTKLTFYVLGERES